MGGPQRQPLLGSSRSVHPAAAPYFSPSLRYDICLVEYQSANTIIVSLVLVGTSCRTKATKALAKRFRTPADAEKHYLALIAPQPPVQLPDMSSGVPPPAPPPKQMTTAEITSYCHQALVPLQAEAHLEILSELFSIYLRENSEIRSVPRDFLELVVQGMRHLGEAGRSNIIYSLAKAVGTMRPDGSDSLLPTKNMPMGLIEYAVNFFTASSIQKVSSTWLPTVEHSIFSSYR